MTAPASAAAQSVVATCREIAKLTDEPGRTTRTFLSSAMKEVHAFVEERMREARLTVSVDPVGNLIGRSTVRRTRRVLIGSHLDTVPNAGAFDGVLGVIIGIALAAKYPVDVIGFSEEEGVRFGRPFIGSRGFTGTLDESWMELRDAANVSLRDAIRAYGLDSFRPEPPDAYIEFHIEQGPVLDTMDAPLGVVRSIAGQSRLSLTVQGKANHAGTTTMHLRADALAGAAEWICTC